MHASDHARSLLSLARKDLDAVQGMVGNPLFADEIFNVKQHLIGRAVPAVATVPAATATLGAHGAPYVNRADGVSFFGVVATMIVGFHAQQAIEKSLKAWLAARSVAFPRTHDLSRLLDLLEENGADVGTFWPLVQYSVFAVQVRYEADLMDGEEPLDRSAAVAEVRQLLATVESAVGG